MGRLRWAVNSTAWIPTREEWLKAMSVVMAEERSRIQQFVFQKDSKFALVGRLLIHAALRRLYPSLQYTLTRSGRGKPCLVVAEGVVAPDTNFNISHQGDYVILALEENAVVGVDVMKFSQPRGTSISQFFVLMKRKFSQHEWQQIATPTSPDEQLKNFYRFWTLKESFIKAEGSGLAFGLQNLEFQCKPGWPPSPGECTLTSQLKICGKPAGCWVFEESVLNDQHCVCVARRGNDVGLVESSLVNSGDLSSPPLATPMVIPPTSLLFREHTVQELLIMLDIEETSPAHIWDNFLIKEL